jgi:hypothetical protein
MSFFRRDPDYFVTEPDSIHTHLEIGAGRIGKSQSSLLPCPIRPGRGEDSVFAHKSGVNEFHERFPRQ